jgi:hypothetical protein
VVPGVVDAILFVQAARHELTGVAFGGPLFGIAEGAVGLGD